MSFICLKYHNNKREKMISFFLNNVVKLTLSVSHTNYYLTALKSFFKFIFFIFLLPLSVKKVTFIPQESLFYLTQTTHM